MFGTIVRMKDMRQMILPVLSLFLGKCSEHLQQGLIEPLRRIALRVIWGSPGMVHARELSESLEQFVFKLPAHIMVEFGWVSEPWNKVIENLVSSSLAGLISGGVCLRKPGEVIDYHQNILVTTTAGLRVEKVNADEFKG